MSWWTRRRGRARARRASPASGSVSRKLPPTIQNTSSAARRRSPRPSPSPSSPAWSGSGKPHALRPCGGRVRGERRARSPPRRRPARRSGRGWAPGRSLGRTGRPRASATLTSALHRVDAVRVLGEAHRPDEDGLRPVDEQLREGFDADRASSPLSAVDGLPVALARVRGAPRRTRRCARRRSPGRCRPPLEQGLQHADEEGQVAAGVDVEPVVGQRGAEEGAARDRRHPVARQARFAQRIHHRDLRRLAPWRGARYFVVTGWLLATFEPKKTMRSASSQSV